jgi:DDE superfamily endonuclease
VVRSRRRSGCGSKCSSRRIPARRDYEYEHRGTANLFMLFAPPNGWRHVKVADCRTIVDFVHVLRDLSDMHFPQAEKIVLVMGNLDTHNLSMLYRAFPPDGTRRLY